MLRTGVANKVHVEMLGLILDAAAGVDNEILDSSRDTVLSQKFMTRKPAIKNYVFNSDNGVLYKMFVPHSSWYHEAIVPWCHRTMVRWYHGANRFGSPGAGKRERERERESPLYGLE